MERESQQRSNVLQFRIPIRTEDPTLPPASAGTVVNFPDRAGDIELGEKLRAVAEQMEAADFADVDPSEISRRFRAARQAGVAEVPITQREAAAVRYWRNQLDLARPRAIVRG